MDTSIIKLFILAGLLLVFSCSSALAQQPIFKVYAVSGKIKVHKPGKKYRDLKVTDELLGNETIKVPNGAVLNLICSNYTPVQINTSGTYKVASLKSNCEQDQSGIITKYFEYIWTELFNKPLKPEAAPLQSMRNKGAVSRGCQGIEIYYPTDTLKLVTNNLELNWDASGKPVTVSLYNSEYEGASIYSSVKKGASVATDEFIDTLLEDDISYLQVVPDGINNCSRYPVIKTSKDAFKSMLDNYKGDFPTKESSSYYFIKSLIEEEKKYLGEALASLNKAIAMEPTNEVYKMHLVLFKEKYNLK
jgi:hypothetical protein